MMQTLIWIPARFWGLNVFGVGWLLLVWLLIAIVTTIWQVRKQGWNRDLWESLPLLAVVAAAIVFLLPQLVEVDAHGHGWLPIRGYGVMLLLAILAGVGISSYRAKQVGLEADVIPGLAFRMILWGLIGARLFFVIEYRHDFFANRSLSEIFYKIINVPSGGLVVYGGLIGGLLAAFVYLRQKQLPFLPVADIIAPGMAIGQAIGRLGCFMNGCCYGGLCTLPLVAVPFPQGSPPYVQQHEMGQLHGIELRAEPRPGATVPQIVVSKVFPGSAAEAAGVKVGDEVRAINGKTVQSLDESHAALYNSGPELEIFTADGRTFSWTIKEFPRWSLPVHPTQIYSFIDASLLAFFLWMIYPYRRHDGEVFALLFTLHPISRILLEAIRTDEPGQFGTGFSISQWLSISFLIAAVGTWFYLERYGKPVDESPQAA